MEDYIAKLPENIQRHLKSVTETSGLPDTEESFALIAENWLEKKKMFEAQIKSLDMIEVDSLPSTSKKPVLLLTYSGSLISIGGIHEGKRWVEYASIKLRADVPDLVIIPETSLANDIKIDECLEFTEGAIKSTSSLLKISCCKEKVSMEEQEKRIREASIFLTNGFTKVNRKITIDREKAPDQFNIKSITGYIANKNNITQKLARLIIDDYLFTLESGLLLGERVPVGRMGKIVLKKRPARKARVITSPRTGEQVTIAAKPETLVPKMSFSKIIKEKSASIEPGA
jgi:nucleoid DNA-binding protein